MTKEELALEVIARLRKEYPDAGCTLDYDQAWKLLVSVRLAAQCTDARVNVVVEDLYAKYPDVASLAAAEPEEIEEINGEIAELEAEAAGYEKEKNEAEAAYLKLNEQIWEIGNEIRELLARMESSELDISALKRQISL